MQKPYLLASIARSKMTLKRTKEALGVRSEKQSDGKWMWELPDGKGVNEKQTLQEDNLDLLDPLPITGPLSPDLENQEDQGDQGGDHESFSVTDNGLHPRGHCKHDVPGGCWLCKKYSTDLEE